MDIDNTIMYISLIVIGCILFRIISQLKESHLQDDPKLKEIMDRLQKILDPNVYYEGYLAVLNNRNILEEFNLYKGTQSYTINKQKIYLCLKDENGEYYNINTLIFVTLHEIAHVICVEIGHTELFDNIFNALLQRASKLNLYDPTKPITQNYCMHGSS
jgi:hypothetical protein